LGISPGNRSNRGGDIKGEIGAAGFGTESFTGIIVGHTRITWGALRKREGIRTKKGKKKERGVPGKGPAIKKRERESGGSTIVKPGTNYQHRWGVKRKKNQKRSYSNSTQGKGETSI